MHEVVRRAIRDKTRVNFWSNGRIRILEPHCHCLDEHGREAVWGYQIGEGWTLFDATDIHKPAPTLRRFEPREEYVRDDERFSWIFAQV